MSLKAVFQDIFEDILCKKGLFFPTIRESAGFCAHWKVFKLFVNPIRLLYQVIFKLRVGMGSGSRTDGAHTVQDERVSLYEHL